MKTILRATAAVAASLALMCAGSVPALGQPPAPPPTTTPFATPDTDACPNASIPPPPVDLSEEPKPGETAPPALPVPDDPIGGDALAECGTVTPDGAPPLPADISATGWVLSDLDTGVVLAAKDPHGRYRPASTIKILLALVVLDELDLNEIVVATAEDAGIEGSAVGIGKGGVYTTLQLVQGLVMASGNDAAHALAGRLGGVEETVEKMNEMAASLGALDTRTASPSGLDGPGMSSSAYDLALFFRTAMLDPTFARLISTETVDFPGYPRDPSIPGDVDKPGFLLANDNPLLFNYAGALGGKTGYTDDARQTFVGGATRDGRRLAVTLMMGEVVPIRPWEQAARLLDYGFALPAGSSVGELAEPGADGTVTSTQLPKPTLATPPSILAQPTDPQAGIRESALAADGATVVRVGFGIIGGLVVLGLLLCARQLNRRR